MKDARLKGETNMEIDEFLEPSDVEEERSAEDVELDVQKAVVESLAADKAMQDEQIESLRGENTKLKAEIERLKATVDKLGQAIVKANDFLAKNTETPLSNKVTLLDRNMELPDAFEGETYDHVLEVIREARDAAEADGRQRRAQILESVLVVNEPNGNLAKRRAALEKLFSDNQNILSGPVINELDNRGIQYKNGENFLLPAEILKKTF